MQNGCKQNCSEFEIITLIPFSTPLTVMTPTPSNDKYCLIKKKKKKKKS